MNDNDLRLLMRSSLRILNQDEVSELVNLDKETLSELLDIEIKQNGYSPSTPAPNAYVECREWSEEINLPL